MSTARTAKMLALYVQTASPTMFLSSFFTANPRNFHESEEVEIDIVRQDEDVAIAIQNVTTGYRMNEADLYTNKGFKPPIYKEAIAMNAFRLLQRYPGDKPFEDVTFRSKLLSDAFNGMAKVEKKIRRAIELQSSQVLQTGKVMLKDENGADVYEIDYKPKATHFPTTGTAWNAASPDILGDIESLVDVVRNDGLEDPDQLIFGSKSFEAALKDEAFMARFEVRRADLGTIAPMKVNGVGGQYRGTLEIGTYKLDIWTYGGRYKDPQTGNTMQYVADNKVIVRSSMARMDASFGAIPNFNAMIGGGAGRLLPELPQRFSLGAQTIDLHTNVWKSNDGENLFAGVGSRPLMIPTAIDTFGAINTLVS